MQRMRTQRLIHTARVKRALEHTVESNKLGGNDKRVRARKAIDLYESGARMQGSDTTYLYLANTGELGHGSDV